MPDKLSEHSTTVRGQVMHDLGQWALKHDNPPTLREARRFTASRAAELKISAAEQERIARQSIRDWRATQRMKELDDSSQINKSYLRDRPTDRTLGVRVRVTFQINSGPLKGKVRTQDVVVNVGPGATLAEIKEEVARRVAQGEVQTKHNNESEKTIQHVEIVQVVEQGFPQAQGRIIG